MSGESLRRKTGEQANLDQAGQVVQMAQELVGDLSDKRHAMLGLAFKKDTDDIREAASLRVIERLKGKGARVVSYDPMAMANAKRTLEGTVDFASSPVEALKGADLCILVTEWDEFRRITQRILGQYANPQYCRCAEGVQPRGLPWAEIHGHWA